MTNKKKVDPIPEEFNSYEEAAEFWDTHDSTKYIDWDMATTLTVHPSIKGPRDLSLRCPHDKQVLLTRWRNLVIADGFATLHRVRELYCPRGDYTRLAPETSKMVKQAEIALKRVRHDTQKAAA